MKTGDTVRDGNGRSFQVGQLIGRGLWGKTYIAREEPGGAEWILKLPLDADAFSTDGEHLAKLCREIALESGRLLSQAGGGLVRPEARFSTELGVPVLVLPRLGPSLHARIEAGATLEELLQAVAAVASLLRSMTGPVRIHGNLRPTNILSDGHGGWLLSDPATETLLRHLPTLARARGISTAWLPPEARGRHERGLSDASVDSHALAAVLLRGASTPRDGAPPPLPDEGMDKAALVALKDAVRNRLKDEPSNPRFHARLADRLSTLLNRALSRETSPSPPYRFPRIDEFQARVEEIAALVQPRVTHVGRVLLDRSPGVSAFTTDEEISFSCSVGCTAGVETHDDIGCGIALFDMERDERLRDTSCSYTVDRHPSGRFRFGFRVASLSPGSYRVRLAFTIRDSGLEPTTTEGELQVHPAAGYVPPRTEPGPKAIRFAPREEPEVVTQTGPVPATDLPPSPGAVAVPLPLPRPAPLSPPAADLPGSSSVAASGSSLPPLPPRLSPPVGPGPAAVVPGPRPVAPPPRAQAEGPRAQAGGERPATAIPLPRPAALRPPEPEPEPEYRGAGRWTDLPLPGAGGPSPVGPDPFADDLTEPLDVEPGRSPLDKLLELAQGDTYRLFLGGAILVIVILILALVALR